MAGKISSDHALAQLPSRVARAIAEQDRRSEILIGAVQLAIGVIWLALYLLAPNSGPQAGMFTPVPIALTAYLSFALFRFWLVSMDWAKPWFLAVAVVLDISILLVLIWSFHLQYMQPAAFYLKAPTMLYLFIFIALRALRFSVGYVLLAGATAGFGWLVLLAYALWTASGTDMGITRDFAAYMTSNAILVGAEFDKVIAIFLTTGILALAILRARKLLVTAVAESTAHRDLNRFFAPEVASRITAADSEVQAGQGELRAAAIMICDIRDFTNYSQRHAPDEVMALLGDYQQRMVGIIEAHGGTVDKFLGDGILASFGAARSAPDYAADALRAADAMDDNARSWARDRLAAGQEALHMGIAIDSGEVIFGAVGAQGRLEFTLIGGAVNRAAKLENANKQLQSSIITSRACFELALTQNYTPARPPEFLDGIVIEGLRDAMDVAILSRNKMTPTPAAAITAEAK